VFGLPAGAAMRRRKMREGPAAQDQINAYWQAERAVRLALWRQPKWVALEVIGLGIQVVWYLVKVGVVGIPLGLFWLGILGWFADPKALQQLLLTMERDFLQQTIWALWILECVVALAFAPPLYSPIDAEVDRTMSTVPDMHRVTCQTCAGDQL